MRRVTLIMLMLSIVLAIAWPLAVYLLYPVPREGIEILASAGDAVFPSDAPRFLPGVGALATFRGANAEFSGLALRGPRALTVLKLGSGERVTLLFMPVYRCGYEEVRDIDVARLVEDKHIAVVGHVFRVHQDFVVVPVKIVIGNTTCVAIPPRR
jgi:hypothetical protein